jgi:large subunit ribosomal protein L9
MKVLLIKDVYKLGRAGDVKRVADGYGRNFLIPQGLAVLATSEALKRTEQIRAQANTRRAVVNKEMSGVADILSKVTLAFPAKAGETGKLYGSITPQMIAEAVKGKTGVEISRRQMDFEPIRTLGTHTVHVRLTIDLIPEITVVVYREGEVSAPSEAKVPAEASLPPAEAVVEAEAAVETEAEAAPPSKAEPEAAE